MPLLFNKGKSSWLQKGNQPRLSDNNTERWRQEQLRRNLKKRATPAKTAEKVEENIEVKPFDGIKEIRAINPNDYFYLSYYIRKVVNPSKDVENAVLTFMVNMFLNLPDNFYQPGKNYSRMERKFTKEQLEVFSQSLTAIELIFDYSNSTIGKFKNNKRVGIDSLDSLLTSNVWNEKDDYHIVYIKSPYEIIPDGVGLEGVASKIIIKKHDRRINALLSYLSEIESKKEIMEMVAYIEKKGQNEIKDLDLKTISKFCNQYAKEHPIITPEQKEFINKINLVDVFLTKVQDEVKKLPDEKIIITTLSKKLKEKSVLILEGSEIKEIPGLKLIDSYNGVSLYQRL